MRSVSSNTVSAPDPWPETQCTFIKWSWILHLPINRKGLLKNHEICYVSFEILENKVFSKRPMLAQEGLADLRLTTQLINRRRRQWTWYIFQYREGNSYIFQYFSTSVSTLSLIPILTPYVEHFLYKIGSTKVLAKSPKTGLTAFPFPGQQQYSGGCCLYNEQRLCSRS